MFFPALFPEALAMVTLFVVLQFYLWRLGTGFGRCEVDMR